MWCDKSIKYGQVFQEKENILPTRVILKKMARQQNKMAPSPEEKKASKHEGMNFEKAIYFLKHYQVTLMCTQENVLCAKKFTHENYHPDMLVPSHKWTS